MARKEKQRLTGMRRGMRILGMFHIIVGCFWLFTTAVITLTVRPDTFSEMFKADCPPVLSFVRSWDNTLTGVFLMIYMLIISTTEFFIGRNWRKKALSTKSQILTLVFSGVKILRALFMLLFGGLMVPKAADIFLLIQNGITFSLAFFMHREYVRKTRTGPSAAS